MTSVERFLELVLAQEGAPYVWGGKGEWVQGRRHAFADARGLQRMVFDCSGLVSWALKRCGWTSRLEMSAHRMWTMWRRTDKPQPGDVICYGKPALCSHVEVVTEDGRTFGAIGGNSRTTQPTRGAAVGYRTKPRPDVLGYVLNPLRSDDNAAAPAPSP